jgi:hypothetical protein
MERAGIEEPLLMLPELKLFAQKRELPRRKYRMKHLEESLKCKYISCLENIDWHPTIAVESLENRTVLFTLDQSLLEDLNRVKKDEIDLIEPPELLDLQISRPRDFTNLQVEIWTDSSAPISDSILPQLFSEELVDFRNEERELTSLDDILGPESPAISFVEENVLFDFQDLKTSSISKLMIREYAEPAIMSSGFEDVLREIAISEFLFVDASTSPIPGMSC